MPHRGFIAGDGFDVHEVARECDDVHARSKENKPQRPRRYTKERRVSINQVFFAIFAAPLGDLCGLGSCTSCKKLLTAKYAKESQSSQRALCDTPKEASQPGTIRWVFIGGPAGLLDALLNAGGENASHGAHD